MEFSSKTDLMNHSRWHCSERKIKKKHVTTRDEPVSPVKKDVSSSDTDSDLQKAIKDEIASLRQLRELKMLKGLSGSSDGSEGNKVTVNIDGQSVALSPSEFMHWKQQEREREDRKLAREDKLEAKEASMITELRRENIELRKEMFDFQALMLQGQMQSNPIDKFLETSGKLEQLGISRSGSAQDELLKQDSKKLDTLLTIIDRKDLSVEKKVDRAIDRFGPSIVDYLKEMVVAMKQQRGVHPESKRSDADYESIASKLPKMSLEEMQEFENFLAKKEVDKKKKTDVKTDDIPINQPMKKVLSIPPKGTKVETSKKTKKGVEKNV